MGKKTSRSSSKRPNDECEQIEAQTGTDQLGRNGTWVYVLGILINLVVFFFMHVKNFAYEDVSFEPAHVPVTVRYAEEAVARDMPVVEFFKTDSRCIDYGRQVPQSNTYPGKLFIFEYMMKAVPLEILAYRPFIKMFGLGNFAVGMFAAFWTFQSLLLMFLVVRHMFGKWYDVLSVLFLQSCITWQIHAKMGSAQWLPSVCITLLLVLCIYNYLKSYRLLHICLGGILVGVAFADVWVGFFLNGLMLFFAVVAAWKRRKWYVLSDLLLVGLVIFLSHFVFIFAYSLIYDMEVIGIYQTFIKSLFTRVSMGAIPAYSPTLFGKFVYALKLLFVDSRQVDHDDKHLEGVPALHLFLAIFLVVGIVLACKRRALPQVIVSFWALLSFLTITLGFLFAHRYSLIFLPALCILAAVGMVGLLQQLFKKTGTAALGASIALSLGLLFANYLTYKRYYVDYTLHKAPSFEVDRLRGHAKVSDFIKSQFADSGALIVLNDYIMTHRLVYELSNFGFPFRYIFFNQHLRRGTPPEEIRSWAKGLVDAHGNVVFVFPTRLLPDQSGGHFNDWRPFTAAYPELKPAYVYSYDGRTLLIVFVMTSGS